MGKALVGVVLGSRADFNIMRRGLESFRIMGVPYIFEMASPHRTPERVVRFAQGAGDMGIEVIVCAAGGSAQIAGMIASYTNLPVIAVPIDSTPLRGQDAMLSMIQMPPGVPIATVGINNAENAALLATQILALKHVRFRAVLAHRRMSLAQRLEGAYKELLGEYPDLVDPGRTSPASQRVSSIGDEDTDPGPGTEDVTPEPEKGPKTEAIRPGAVLVHRGAVPPALGASFSAGKLVQTPAPQEPSSGDDDEYIGTESETPSPDVPDFTPRSFQAAGPTSLPHDLKTPRLFGQLPPPEESIPDTDPVGKNPIKRKSSEAVALPPREVETKVFAINRETPDEDVLTHAMMVLLEGGIVAFPTDTVYGLAVDATNPEAVRRLYDVKGHDPSRKSLSVLIHAREQLGSLVREVPPEAEPVLQKFWPGGLTVLFFKQPAVLAGISESPSIAIRIPNDDVALNLMRMIDRPLAVINAATQDSPSATTPAEVADRFTGRIDCILDAGECTAPSTSTVLSILTDPYEVLREGTVATADLKELLREKLRA